MLGEGKGPAGDAARPKARITRQVHDFAIIVGRTDDRIKIGQGHQRNLVLSQQEFQSVRLDRAANAQHVVQEFLGMIGINPLGDVHDPQPSSAIGKEIAGGRFDRAAFNSQNWLTKPILPELGHVAFPIFDRDGLAQMLRSNRTDKARDVGAHAGEALGPGLWTAVDARNGIAFAQCPTLS